MPKYVTERQNVFLKYEEQYCNTIIVNMAYT